ncbi:MAG: transcriptional regulator AsnC [Gammaproteobacteria bacterium CG22_combo_CG10-13_8_21_14_all_40_8]|nr:MAG: transcriptional regulator AsnC [Gammaproteobacteria bacterium CG22_combo_CG10-13_8_21_14_all_40_8]
MTNLTSHYTIDNLDKNILLALIENARVSYAELAKKFEVSPGTIHVRVEKMKMAGVIEGTKVKINAKKLGYDVCCFIGINLKSAKDYHQVVEKLNEFEEVLEAHFTTGQYSILVKIVTQSIDQLQVVLIDKIQKIDEVLSTDTLISLQNPINRGISPVKN